MRDEEQFEASKNMELWDQVCETDPKITTHVNQRGGFTALDAQCQIKRATEIWGAYGHKWGVREVEYVYLRDSVGMVEEIAINGTFYYPAGEFYISSDMPYFVFQQTKHGPSKTVGNDSRKKLLTDITTKALSKLGFNSDVFEGRFDGNKYVMATTEKFGGEVNHADEGLMNELNDLICYHNVSDDEVKKIMEWAKVSSLPDLTTAQAGIIKTRLLQKHGAIKEEINDGFL